MYHRKLMEEQLYLTGLRLGDSCCISPFYGKKKVVALKSKKIDIISGQYRPKGLSFSYIELPNNEAGPFHYRLELDQRQDELARFVLKTIEGRPFWLNGLAVREAYVERSDRLYIGDNKIKFEAIEDEADTKMIEHSILREKNLIESELKILILGETGTGKSHLAEKIHEYGKKTGPFVAVNLSSFNSQLIESELFGHKKGSFTGAIQDKLGAFSIAEGGTLFLDEIDSLPLDLQTKLLTFIDNKKFRRVGDTKENSIRTRMVFASGRSLELLVEQGYFRRDLFFRLTSGYTVELKSLRNEVNKIKTICLSFAERNHISISSRLLEFYQTLAWPGNLRQLLGHLEKKKILSRSTKIDFDQYDEELLLQSSDLMNLGDSKEILPMEKMKTDYIKRAFGLCEGNIAMTARKLKVNEKTIRLFIQKN